MLFYDAISGAHTTRLACRRIGKDSESDARELVEFLNL